MLQIEALSGGYGSRQVVHDIHLIVAPGEWLSCVGPNGCGKSTLLRLICRILVPQTGRVLLGGEALHTQPPHQVARQLAILPQQLRIPAGLKVLELVALGRSPHRPWWDWSLSQRDQQAIWQALEQVKLLNLAQRRVDQLSGGERQRAFLALSLAQDPKVLLLDEPTTYLDLRYQLELLDLLAALNQERQLTIITVLHDLNLAARYSHRMILLHQGRIAARGSPAQVLSGDNLREVFGLKALVTQTPLGLQIWPLGSTTSLSSECK